MKINFIRFNIVLLLVILALGTGCQSSSKKKKATTFRVHLEVFNPDRTNVGDSVSIGKSGMFTVTVNKQPFLDEGHVAQASVVKAMGGFAIMVQLDRRGSWVLEMTTTESRGKRMAIFSQFGEARWLAAPEITRTIKDGVLVFTPDATLEECERLVKGLNEVAKVAQKNNP